LPLNVAVDIFPKVLGAGTVLALVAVCKKVLAANPIHERRMSRF
jgi:hypothetical protein